jgi:hypothetical protein
MKLKTERLLQQCRAVLLQYSNEQLNTLFLSWLERMVGEEYMDEALDDFCLLLGYGIRSSRSNTLYATYTTWWEIEGSADPDGEFECLDEDGVAALQHRLINMPIKQFTLISELAVPPWELETLLGCTTTEHKRWTEEEKCPILGYGNFCKAGSNHDYPVYDRRIILSLTRDDIECWRSEHQAMVRERRRVAARAAAANRKAKQQAEQMAHDHIVEY